MFIAKFIHRSLPLLQKTTKLYSGSNFNSCRLIQTATMKFCHKEQLDIGVENLSERFGYSEGETESIIKNINLLSKEDMLKFKISKKIISAFFTRKIKVGSYNAIVDLLYIDGVGMKQAMRLCEIAMSETPNDLDKSEEEFKTKLLGLMNRKRFIKPNFQCEDCENLVAVTVNPNHLAWTELICSERRVVDIQYRNISKSMTKVNISKIHDTVLDSVCDIPDADVYIVEHIPLHFNLSKSTGLNSARVNYLINNALIRGIALTLLQSKASKGFYYLSDSVPMRLFNLKVGFDRQSSVNLVKCILNNTHDIPWLPEVYSEDRQYFHVSHPPASDSTLLALSFLETIYNKNVKALELLL